MKQTKRSRISHCIKKTAALLAVALCLHGCSRLQAVDDRAVLEPQTTVEEPGAHALSGEEEELSPEGGEATETSDVPSNAETVENGPSVPGAPGIFAVNPEAAASPQVVLKLVDGETPGAQDHGHCIANFVSLAEAISGGSIHIEIQDTHLSGDNVAILDRMTDQDPLVDLAVVTPIDLAIFGDDKSPILSMPFLFRSHDQFVKFAESSLGQAFLDSPGIRGIGVQSLFFIDEGFRYFASTDQYKIRDLSDLYTLRMASGTEKNMLYRSLVGQAGAFIQWIEKPDLHDSFAAGFDVAPVTMQEFQGLSLADCAQNLSLDRHSMSIFELVIRDDSWTGRLTAAQRNALQQAARLAMRENLARAPELESALQNSIRDSGVNLVETQSHADWQKDVSLIIKNNVPPNLMPYYQAIDALG